ncbi:protein SPIRAL1-like 3 isoform X1 [Gastrolobium bilobum]|uniref:protein SPIRAL1-like 3 isoform X1 n=1 Tax=Gastrolobium bilobum TaxID=150636 RepID=UPI002AB2B4D0|nr:protein SPIRAL1-like 3 isoform X1 [Gastrolobium bilobum]
MGRGISSGGGQSSLGYLFGSEETASNVQSANNQGHSANGGRSQNASVASPPIDKQIQAGIPSVTSPPIDKGIPAGIPGNLKNNYHRADGQNCGNFLTDRPSTKVHAAPGGGSSLDYLFGGPGN